MHLTFVEGVNTNHGACEASLSSPLFKDTPPHNFHHPSVTFLLPGLVWKIMGRESSRAGRSEQHCTSVRGNTTVEPAAVGRIECQMVEGLSR